MSPHSNEILKFGCNAKNEESIDCKNQDCDDGIFLNIHDQFKSGVKILFLSEYVLPASKVIVFYFYWVLFAGNGLKPHYS